MVRNCSLPSAAKLGVAHRFGRWSVPTDRLRIRQGYLHGALANDAQLHVGYTLAKAENLSGSGDGEVEVLNRSVRSSAPGWPTSSTSRPIEASHRLINVIGWLFDAFGRRSGQGCAAFLTSGIYTAESGCAVASNLSMPSIPFATPDGVEWSGFGGVRGQGGANFLSDHSSEQRRRSME